MKILVFRTGSLGDTLAALPALWAIKENFKNDRLTFLCDGQPGRPLLSRQVLEGTGIFDDFILYSSETSIFARGMQFSRLFCTLHARRFKTLIYLYQSMRPQSLADRDCVFFKLAGIERILANKMTPAPLTTPGAALPVVRHEAYQLLDGLHAGGLTVPQPTNARFDLALRDDEFAIVTRWLSDKTPDAGRPWLAIGPGSKMPAKIWPTERYIEVLKRLQARFDFWPVVFGGPEDRADGEYILKSTGRGYNLAGVFPVRPSAAAISRCCMYLGNDTGTMHLAAAVRVPCVAVFSARDFPGAWYPLGKGHTVLRHDIECEGCMLQDCTVRNKECLTAISVDEVYAACATTMSSALSRADDSGQESGRALSPYGSRDLI